MAAWFAALALASPCRPQPVSAPAAQKARNTYIIPTPAPADYSSLQWLIGDWSGKIIGKGTPGKVLLSVSFALGRRVIILREQLSLAATKAAPASEEQSMGILSASGRSYDFALYSSTGFVTRYQVSVENGEIDFTPEGGLDPPAGWLFRRSIRLTNSHQCVETVDVAPPNQPFFNYYTASLRHTAPHGSINRPSAASGTKHHRILFWRRN
jgi:hypothetical protein